MNSALENRNEEIVIDMKGEMLVSRLGTCYGL